MDLVGTASGTWSCSLPMPSQLTVPWFTASVLLPDFPVHSISWPLRGAPAAWNSLPESLCGPCCSPRLQQCSSRKLSLTRRSDIVPHPMYSFSYYSVILSLELLLILLSHLLPQLGYKLQNQGCSYLILHPRAWLKLRTLKEYLSNE